MTVTGDDIGPTAGLRIPVPPVRPSSASLANTGLTVRKPGEAASFQAVLRREMLKLSHHAEVRLRQRGIELTNEDWNRIGAAVEKAEAKGAKDSLIVLKGLALIVNVPNRTVVTAVEQASNQDHVFTQIDSAVILS